MTAAEQRLAAAARRQRFDDWRMRAGLVLGVDAEKRKALAGFIDFGQHAAVAAGALLSSGKVVGSFNIAQRAQHKPLLENASLEAARRQM